MEEKFATFRSIGEIVPCGLLAVNADRRIRVWNREAERITGIPAPVALGRRCRQLLGCRQSCPLDRTVLAMPVIKRAGFWKVDGRLVQVVSNLQAIKTCNGQKSCLVETFSGHCPQAETSGRLKSAKARDNIGAIIDGLEHELRTPVSSIHGLVDLLACTPQGGVQSRVFELIRHSAEMAVDLMEDIMVLKQMEQGCFVPENGWFDLQKLLTAIVGRQSRVNFAKGNKIEQWIASDVPVLLKGDQARLAMIINRLMDNVFQTSNGGRIEIRVSVVQFDDDYGCGVSRPAQKVILEFAVEGNGAGLRWDEMEPAFRDLASPGLPVPKSKRFLGFLMARALVKKMGGRMWVESSPDSGIMTNFTLPFEIAASETVTLRVPGQERTCRLRGAA